MADVTGISGTRICESTSSVGASQSASQNKLHNLNDYSRDYATDYSKDNYNEMSPVPAPRNSGTERSSRSSRKVYQAPDLDFSNMSMQDFQNGRIIHRKDRKSSSRSQKMYSSPDPVSTKESLSLGANKYQDNRLLDIRIND